MANKRVFKFATASAVAASALVAAVPASAASVTYEQAEKQVNKAREAANGLHAEYTRNADYKTVVDSKEARDELARAKAKIAALSNAKQKAYLNTRIQGTIDTVERANKYNNAVRVAVTYLPEAHKALETALVNVKEDVATAEMAKEKFDTYVKQAEINFGKVYGAAIQAKFKEMYLTDTVYKAQKDAADKIAEAKAVVKVESVSAINAKTIKVTFNKEVDFKGEDFAVSKGTVKSNIANVTLAADKKSAQIELTSKLTKGDYTVTVKQAGKDSLTGLVSVQDERVSSLNILSDIAPMGSGNTTATVGASVTNQYGEDITKLNASSVTVTVSGAATGGTLNTDGTLTLTGINASSVKEGDKVTITLVHGATATTTTKTVSLSAASVSSEATVGSLFNKDGKTLNQDSDVVSNKFYLPITVKDQYGKEITNVDKANNELIITNTNPAVASFADDNEIKEVTIDGKDVLALEVSGVGVAGQTTVLAISKSNGKSTQGTVVVAEGVKINSAALSAPTELVTANKDAYFPLSVVDSSGNEVKTLKALNAINDNLTVTGGSVVEVAGKGLFVKVLATNVDVNVPVTVVVNTSTGKVSTQTVVPKAEAVATVITGLSKDVDTAIRENGDLTIDNSDLIVEDQYGQVISDEDALEALTFTVAGPDALTFTATSAQTSGVDNHKSYTIAPANGATKVSDKLTFKLLAAGGTAIESSAFTKSFSIVKDADFASYKVEDLAPIYVARADANSPYAIVSGYDKDLVVKATSKSGSVVTLTEGADYFVTGKNPAVSFATGSDIAKQTVTITINATGEQLTKEITYSKAAAAPVKVELAADGTTAAASKYDIVTREDVTSAVDADAIEALVDIIVTDQYGVKMLADDADAGETGIDTLTFTKVSGNVTFDANGTSTAKVVAADDNAVVNAIINVGGQKATVQLTFTSPVTP